MTPNQIELKQGVTYIVRGEKASTYDNFMKIKIVELTKETVVVQNLDAETKPKWRESIGKFKAEWKIIEQLQDEDLNALLKQI